MQISRKFLDEYPDTGNSVAAGLRARLVLASVTALVAALLFCPAADAAYQVQIGSTKDIRGAHYFAGKASKVLGQAATIIEHGGFYTVLVGQFDKRDEAVKAYLSIIKHYNALISSYENPLVVAVYVDGVEGGTEAAAASSGEATAAVSVPAIRQVKESELALLKKALEKSLANVVIEGCQLKSQEIFDQHSFISTCRLAALDPGSVAAEERHGKPYIKAEFLIKGEAVRTEGRVNEKSVFTGAEGNLLLRCTGRGHEEIQETVKALRELIQYCVKEKK